MNTFVLVVASRPSRSSQHLGDIAIAAPPNMRGRCNAVGTASQLLHGTKPTGTNEMLEPFVAPPGGYERGSLKRLYHVTYTSKAMRLCSVPAVTAVPVVPAGSQAVQMDAPPDCSQSNGAALAAHGVRILVGVLSAPRNRVYRDAVRQSWMGWGAAHGALICFVLGRVGVPLPLLRVTDQEASSHQDIMWLPHTSDGCYLTISKVYDFWKHAATRLEPGGVRHVVKVDEDSFLHLPNLRHDLSRLACINHLYYGGGAWAGYHPHKYTMCGFSWRGDSAYARYGCAAAGAHPPFPFVMGGLQALSAPLVSHLATSRA